jgi:hypothetical protein
MNVALENTNDFDEQNSGQLVYKVISTNKAQCAQKSCKAFGLYKKSKYIKQKRTFIAHFLNALAWYGSC